MDIVPINFPKYAKSYLKTFHNSFLRSFKIMKGGGIKAKGCVFTREKYLFIAA